MRKILTLVQALLFSLVATAAIAAPLDVLYFVGVDSLQNLPSGTYAGLQNPNHGRLTFLFNHGDHYHGIGAYSYTGPVGSPTVLPTNANNTIPELSTGLPPLSLEAGSGAYAGSLVSGLGTAPQDHEYGDLRMLATAALDATGDPADQVPFHSSGDRWSSPLGARPIGLELISISAGLQIGDSAGNVLFPGVGHVLSLGLGDALSFNPVFFTDSPVAAAYTATFRLHDLGAATGGSTAFGSSGEFTLAFRVPEPSALVAIALGLACVAGLRFQRSVQPEPDPSA